ncbi:MAG: molybdenum cofactor biosynthesis protein MoaB [Promethearchaeota archaeon]|nr:MAG: molybdenum cofactor biosynthesis protein MoaB [Candidatus Lokiarchaeota archaeon]
MKVHEEHKKKAPKKLAIGIIVVSSSRFNELSENKQSSDKTIPTVKKILENYEDISLVHSEIIADSEAQIKETLANLIKDDKIDALIFSGGTGLSPKDITYETIEPLLEKELSGFGELFRYLSYEEIRSSAMLSRAIGGIIKKKVIFLLPGSPNAVKLALDKLILPELGHMIYLINKIE